ncbi:MAG: cytochrome C oxidase subunit IV family protein [Planctomycetaceae bacterium]|nr:cytochrome C oxidase subunit IV family protein [Planctomycetaceae bacterium]
MAAHAHDHAEYNPIGHVASKPMLLTVFFLLVGLTALTIWQGTQLELGTWELIIVLVIATAKASLVVLFFMHLRYDKPLNVFAFLSSLLFMSLFIGLTLADAVNYQPEVSAKEEDAASP